MVRKGLVVSQLTAYERRRLNKCRQCKSCGREIHDYQRFDMVKIRDRREVIYYFYHTTCATQNGYCHEGDD